VRHPLDLLENRCQSLDSVRMTLNGGDLVWARGNPTDIYWPGRILRTSDSIDHSWLSYPSCNYLVQFFASNQSSWLDDLVPYCQYRDCMTENSFMDYGLHPAIRQDFLNAIQQADFASGNSLLASHQSAPAMASSTPQKPEYSLNTMDTNVDSDFLLNSMQGLTSNIGKNASVRVRLKP
jgi:hypothetical protein